MQPRTRAWRDWKALRHEAPPSPRAAFERRLSRTYQQALAARAVVEAMPDLAEAAAAEVAMLGDDASPDLPMARLAGKLGLRTEQIELLWCIVACSFDGRLVPHLEALGGAHARRGLSPAVYGMLVGLDDDSPARLAHWLASPNPLVDTGLVTAAEPASPAARAYVASSRLVSFLAGEVHPIEPLRLVAAPADPLHDDAQLQTIDELRAALDHPADTVIVIEGPVGSGRVTAAAIAGGTGLVVLDFAHV